MNGGGDADFNDLKRLRLRRPMAVTSIAETETANVRIPLRIVVRVQLLATFQQLPTLRTGASDSE